MERQYHRRPLSVDLSPTSPWLPHRPAVKVAEDVLRLAAGQEGGAAAPRAEGRVELDALLALRRRVRAYFALKWQRTRGFVPKAVLLRRYPLPWSLLAIAATLLFIALGSVRTHTYASVKASAQPCVPPASIVTCGSKWHANAPAKLGRWSCCVCRPAIVSALFVALASAGAVQVDRRTQ